VHVKDFLQGSGSELLIDIHFFYSVERLLEDLEKGESGESGKEDHGVRERLSPGQQEKNWALGVQHD
jgi:hypothetical protein